jgi:hypothetical protein
MGGRKQETECKIRSRSNPINQTRDHISVRISHSTLSKSNGDEGWARSQFELMLDELHRYGDDCEWLGRKASWSENFLITLGWY